MIFPVLFQPEQLAFDNNAVCVIVEDMRYAKSKKILDKFGKEYDIMQGPIVHRSDNKNLVVDPGRIEVLSDLFGFGGVASFLAGSVGDDPAGPTDATKVRLNNELIANATRQGLTDTATTALDATDIVSEVSGSNRKKIITQFIFDTTDSNNGSTFAEYGVHSTTTLPGTPTTQSGTMLARFVPTSSIVKTVSFRVTVQWLFRS